MGMAGDWMMERLSPKLAFRFVSSFGKLFESRTFFIANLFSVICMFWRLETTWVLQSFRRDCVPWMEGLRKTTCLSRWTSELFSSVMFRAKLTNSKACSSAFINNLWRRKTSKIAKTFVLLTWVLQASSSVMHVALQARDISRLALVSAGQLLDDCLSDLAPAGV